MAVLELWFFTLLVAEKIFALEFTVSDSRVKFGAQGIVTFVCKVTEKDVDLIYNIQIRRQTDPGKAFRWETLAEIEVSESKVSKLNKDIVNDKDFIVGGILDEDDPVNTCLNLTMQKEKLTYSDTRDYRCELTYKNKRTGLVLSNGSNVTLVVYETKHSAHWDSKIIYAVLASTNILTIIYACFITYKVRTRGAENTVDEPEAGGEELMPRTSTDTKIFLSPDQQNLDEQDTDLNKLDN